MASRVVSLRLKEAEAEYLTRQARVLQRSIGETAALLLSEKLKEEAFPYIEFRQTVRGRVPYVKSTRLAVWQVVMVGRDLDMSATRVVEHLGWPSIEQIQAALNFYAAYPDSVDVDLDHADSMTPEKLRQTLPALKVVRVSASTR
jgi:uncharacterized protein (DUF433 family)